MSGSTGNINANIPAPVAPLVDENGNITSVWRAYFITVQRRTGGTKGVSISDHVTQVNNEVAAQSAANQALQQSLDAEVAARISADSAEQSARSAMDDWLTTNVQSAANVANNEVIRAQAAEALLVPLTQLCTLWGQCDLSFLPTSDPGGGMPWLDGNHLAVGTPGAALNKILLEDGSGFITEEGAGDWLWG